MFSSKSKTANQDKLASKNDKSDSNSNKPISSNEIVVESLKRGDQALAQGQVAEAQQYYGRVMQYRPDNAAANHGMAIIADQQQRYGEAEKFYLTALRGDPRNPDILGNLGYSYYLQNKLPESERYLRQALELRPNHKRSASHLASVYAKLGDYDRSLAMLRMSGSEAEAQTEIARLFPGRGGPGQAPGASYAQNNMQNNNPTNPFAGNAQLVPLQQPFTPPGQPGGPVNAQNPQLAANTLPEGMTPETYRLQKMMEEARAKGLNERRAKASKDNPELAAQLAQESFSKREQDMIAQGRVPDSMLNNLMTQIDHNKPNNSQYNQGTSTAVDRNNSIANNSMANNPQGYPQGNSQANPFAGQQNSGQQASGQQASGQAPWAMVQTPQSQQAPTGAPWAVSPDMNNTGMNNAGMNTPVSNGQQSPFSIQNASVQNQSGQNMHAPDAQAAMNSNAVNPNATGSGKLPEIIRHRSPKEMAENSIPVNHPSYGQMTTNPYTDGKNSSVNPSTQVAQNPQQPFEMGRQDIPVSTANLSQPANQRDNVTPALNAQFNSRANTNSMVPPSSINTQATNSPYANPNAGMPGMDLNGMPNPQAPYGNPQNPYGTNLQDQSANSNAYEIARQKAAEMGMGIGPGQMFPMINNNEPSYHTPGFSAPGLNSPGMNTANGGSNMQYPHATQMGTSPQFQTPRMDPTQQMQNYQQQIMTTPMTPQVPAGNIQQTNGTNGVTTQQSLYQSGGTSPAGLPMWPHAPDQSGQSPAGGTPSYNGSSSQQTPYVQPQQGQNQPGQPKNSDRNGFTKSASYSKPDPYDQLRQQVNSQYQNLHQNTQGNMNLNERMMNHSANNPQGQNNTLMSTRSTAGQDATNPNLSPPPYANGAGIQVSPRNDTSSRDTYGAPVQNPQSYPTQWSGGNSNLPTIQPN
jgi:tetratricopeptide (TPR) repeat protein